MWLTSALYKVCNGKGTVVGTFSPQKVKLIIMRLSSDHHHIASLAVSLSSCVTLTNLNLIFVMTMVSQSHPFKESVRAAPMRLKCDVVATLGFHVSSVEIWQPTVAVWQYPRCYIGRRCFVVTLPTFTFITCPRIPGLLPPSTVYLWEKEKVWGQG